MTNSTEHYNDISAPQLYRIRTIANMKWWEFYIYDVASGLCGMWCVFSFFVFILALSYWPSHPIHVFTTTDFRDKEQMEKVFKLTEDFPEEENNFRAYFTIGKE